MKIKRFCDLVFEEHPKCPGEGNLQAMHFFPNDYGISITKFRKPSFFSRIPPEGRLPEGEWEVAIVKGNKKNYVLVWENSIIEGGVQNCSEAEIDFVLSQVQKMPAFISQNEAPV